MNEDEKRLGAGEMLMNIELVLQSINKRKCNRCYRGKTSRGSGNVFSAKTLSLRLLGGGGAGGEGDSEMDVLLSFCSVSLFPHAPVYYPPLISLALSIDCLGKGDQKCSQIKFIPHKKLFASTSLFPSPVYGGNFSSSCEISN